MPSYQSVRVMFGGRPCVIPEAGFAGRANSFWCPLGAAYGQGELLMTRGDVAILAASAFHELRMESVSETGAIESVTFPNLMLRRAVRQSKGAPNDPSALYKLEIVDRRWILNRFSDTGLLGMNLRSFAQASPYLQGSEGYTWELAARALWNSMSSHLGSFPGLPEDVTLPGFPEDLRYLGVNAWKSLNAFLERIECAVRYDPVEDAFSIVSLQAPQPEFDLALSGNLLSFDANPIEPAGTKIPEVFRIYFRKHYRSFGQERDTEIGQNWHVAGTAHVEEVASYDEAAIPGAALPLWDDLPLVLDEDNQPENAFLVASRAQKRVADWIARAKNSDSSRRRVFAGLTANVLPGPQVKGVLWRVFGPSANEGAIATEWISYPGSPSASRSLWSRRSIRESTVDLDLDRSLDRDENFQPPDLGRRTTPSFPRVVNLVRVESSGGSGTAVPPNSDGLHSGRACRWVAGGLRLLDPCWVRFVDSHDERLGQVLATAGDYYGPARLCGIETSEGSTRPIYLCRKGESADSNPVRWGIVTNASSQIQPSEENHYCGMIDVAPTPNCQGDPIEGAEIAKVVVPHRGPFPESSFYLPNGTRVAYAETVSGEYCLVTDYDAWERFRLYWGRVLEQPQTTSGVTTVKVRVSSTQKGPANGPEVLVILPDRQGYKPGLSEGDTIAFRHMAGLPLSREGLFGLGDEAWLEGPFVCVSDYTAGAFPDWKSNCYGKLSEISEVTNAKRIRVNKSTMLRLAEYQGEPALEIGPGPTDSLLHSPSETDPPIWTECPRVGRNVTVGTTRPPGSQYTGWVKIAGGSGRETWLGHNDSNSGPVKMRMPPSASAGSHGRHVMIRGVGEEGCVQLDWTSVFGGTGAIKVQGFDSADRPCILLIQINDGLWHSVRCAGLELLVPPPVVSTTCPDEPCVPFDPCA